MTMQNVHDQQLTGAVDPRVAFAAERTLLAWIRTGLALMGFGFVVARFGLFMRELAHVDGSAPHGSYGVSFWVGSGLIVLGVFINALAAAEHVRVIRRLRRNDPWVLKPSALGLTLAALLAAIGIALNGYLVLNTP